MNIALEWMRKFNKPPSFVGLCEQIVSNANHIQGLNTHNSHEINSLKDYRAFLKLKSSRLFQQIFLLVSNYPSQFHVMIISYQIHSLYYLGTL